MLDLSASVSQDTYSRIGETLETAGREAEARYGLVVFSGVRLRGAPPGTPASALRPLVRNFTLPEPAAPGFFAPTSPLNPWSSTFSGRHRDLDRAWTLARQLR